MHSDKASACQSRRLKRHGFDAWVGKIPWNRKWQPDPVFCLRNSATVHGATKSQTRPSTHIQENEDMKCGEKGKKYKDSSPLML